MAAVHGAGLDGHSRVSRAMALVRAAARLADGASDVGRRVRRELAAQGPLTIAGVELALERHLATGPDKVRIDELVQASGCAGYVHVVLASNVFVGALQALAVAVAASPRVTVRLSRRESVFARHLLEQARMEGVDIEQRAEPSHRWASQAWQAGQEAQVHLYGRDETIGRIASGLDERVQVRAHGAGMGIVVVGKSADARWTADQVARDVIAFDQRGCLSPRVVFVEGGPAEATAFAQALALQLEAWAKRVPLGSLWPEEREQKQRYLLTCRMAGRLWDGAWGAVGLTPTALWVGPPGRHVHVMACEGLRAGGARREERLGQLASMLLPLRHHVVALGVAGASSDALVAAARELCPEARVSDVGQMQRPLLDGFVDLRGPGLLTPRQVMQRYAAGQSG